MESLIIMVKRFNMITMAIKTLKRIMEALTFENIKKFAAFFTDIAKKLAGLPGRVISWVIKKVTGAGGAEAGEGIETAAVTPGGGAATADMKATSIMAGGQTINVAPPQVAVTVTFDENFKATIKKEFLDAADTNMKQSLSLAT
jgi:hypothetical protein